MDGSEACYQSRRALMTFLLLSICTSKRPQSVSLLVHMAMPTLLHTGAQTPSAITSGAENTKSKRVDQGASQPVLTKAQALLETTVDEDWSEARNMTSAEAEQMHGPATERPSRENSKHRTINNAIRNQAGLKTRR